MSIQPNKTFEVEEKSGEKGEKGRAEWWIVLGGIHSPVNHWTGCHMYTHVAELLNNKSHSEQYSMQMEYYVKCTMFFYSAWVSHVINVYNGTFWHAHLQFFLKQPLHWVLLRYYTTASAIATTGFKTICMYQSNRNPTALLKVKNN